MSSNHYFIINPDDNFLFHRDQQILNETLFQTLVHTVQILCLVLYISLGPIIFFHYLFASTTTILVSLANSNQILKRQ